MRLADHVARKRQAINIKFNLQAEDKREFFRRSIEGKATVSCILKE
jgi:hypothetical protein